MSNVDGGVCSLFCVLSTLRFDTRKMSEPVKKKKKNIWLIAAAALFLSACGKAEPLEEQPAQPSEVTEAAIETETAGGEAESESPVAGLAGAAEVKEESGWQPDEELARQKQNYSDVIARIVIPGTVIEELVFSSPYDDARYLNTDRDGKASSAGELFVERTYNRIDFADPVTIVYGHNMRSGKMFGYLQEYYQGVKDGISAGEAMKKYGTVEISTPEGTLTYKVFAAIPFDNRHILAGTDFTNTAAHVNFFTEIRKTRALGGYVDRSVAVVPKDKVLILSTCMPDHESRFLVFGKLTGAKTGEQTGNE